VICFGEFAADLETRELRRNGNRVKLQGQPFEILAILLQRPGRMVTREEFRQKLWPSDTFVDFEHGLNAAVNKLRGALGDSAEAPTWIDTLPRRGYRFIGKVESDQARIEQQPKVAVADTRRVANKRARGYWLLVAALAVITAGGITYRLAKTSNPSPDRTLTRLTFDNGLQVGATLSPDGGYIAYASNRGGKFDIWMQQVSGAGSPVRVTQGAGNNWEPEWSPDGKYIAYRSEDQDGGLFIVPVLGGAGLQRKIANFGYYPHWSPDGSKLIFQTHHFALSSKVFLVNIADGSAPHEILESVTRTAYIMSAAWHPDGKEVSLWGWEMVPSPIPTFWTGPADAPGAVRKTEVTPELLKLASSAAGQGFGAWGDSDYKFSWDRSGQRIYFERMFRGARNIWRMTVDAQTLQATRLERITTGTEFASDFGLSADGNKLVFTSKVEAVQAWVFPLYGSTGTIGAVGQPVTSAGMEAWEGDLSRDGTKLVFSCKRAGQWDLCEKSLSAGNENTLTFDDTYIRDEPHWSPDGTHLAYIRLKPSTGETQAVTWDSKTRSENTVTELRPTGMLVFDWSPDGQWLLASTDNPNEGQTEIWRFRAAGVRGAGDAQKLLTLGRGIDIFQEHFSPNGRWIVFEGIKTSTQGGQSAIYVSPSDGGSWAQITDGKQWQDKPRWSGDGRTIFFISERNGFLNVFSVPFDPVKGKAAGAISQLTDFKTADLAIAGVVPTIGFSLAADKAMLTISQSSGGVWLLDHLNR